jgi:hypothetical protein
MGHARTAGGEPQEALQEVGRILGDMGAVCYMLVSSDERDSPRRQQREGHRSFHLPCLHLR